MSIGSYFASVRFVVPPNGSSSLREYRDMQRLWQRDALSPGALEAWLNKHDVGTKVLLGSPDDTDWHYWTDYAFLMDNVDGKWLIFSVNFT